MATFATSDCQNACDNLGYCILTVAAALPTASTISTLQTNLGTEITRINALSDQFVQSTLERAWLKEQRATQIGLLQTGRVINWLNTALYANLLANGPFEACDALDLACSQVSPNTGLANFLANNNLMIDQYTADVFNQFVSSVISAAYIRSLSNTTPAAIAAANIFTHSNVNDLYHWTASGASSGTLVAGTGSLAANTGGSAVPGGGTLECYAGNGIGNSAYTITVTYTRLYDGSSQTLTFSVTANATSNTVFTPSGTVQASAVTAVAVTTGNATSGDILRFRVKPVRSIAA